MTALKASTRVAKVAVAVGVALAVEVAVFIGVMVCVGVAVRVGNNVFVGLRVLVKEGSTIRVGKSFAEKRVSNGTERKAAMLHTNTQAIIKTQNTRRRIATSLPAPLIQVNKNSWEIVGNLLFA